MARITVTTSPTTILSGSQTVNTAVFFGAKPVRIATGSPTGRTYANATPVPASQIVIFPASLQVTAWVDAGEATVWTEGFGE
jgi:hypothetical protein